MPGVDDVVDAALIAERWGDPLEGIVLFGSAARNERWATSDIDLLIVLPEGTPPRRSHYDRWDALVAPHCGSKVSPSIVMYPAEPGDAGGIWFEAAVDGVILWDPAGRVAHLFAAIRRAISEGEILRGESHGHPYWFRRGRSA